MIKQKLVDFGVKMRDRVSIKSGTFKIDSICKGELQSFGKLWYFGCLRCGDVLKLSHKVILKGDNVSISPSIGCPACRLHIFVRDNVIEYLPNF